MSHQEPEGVWLRGDLHLHSHHSKDALDNPMSALVPLAESFGMDFFVVTDHDNHVDGELTTWDDPAYRSDAMLLLYGVEWTTSLGHANIFGAAPFDHAPFWALRDGEGGAIVAEARRQGVHFSINHPVGKDLWEYGFDIDFDSLEVWNALYTFPNDTPGATRLWDSLIAEGRTIAARGGSDCHHQEGVEAMAFNLGNPTTWVLARERSGEAVLEALRRGRTSISYAPLAERVELRADTDRDGGYESIMGDVITEVPSRPIRLEVRVIGAREGAAYSVQIFRNGALLDEQDVTARGETLRIVRDDQPTVGGRTWYRAEVRGSLPLAPPLVPSLYGGVVGITNPIYVGFAD
jgi:hypothetical protein